MRTATTCQITTTTAPIAAISTVRTIGGQPKLMPMTVTAIPKFMPVAMLPTVARQVISHQILKTWAHGTCGGAPAPKSESDWSAIGVVRGIGGSLNIAKNSKRTFTDCGGVGGFS